MIDAATSEPLPYVNIGIIYRNIGTATDTDGRFDISIPAHFIDDTLTFSLVGYGRSSYLIDALSPEDETIRLVGKETLLSQVDINAERLVERKVGIKNRNLLMHFSDGMFQEDDVFEIGQLIKLKGSKALITSVNLFLFDSDRDSATFRLNFYDLENGKPSNRLVERPIVLRRAVEEGWLRLDISQENIVLEGDFVAALEFLPEENQSDRRVAYEVKLGGSSRSFYRKSSLGSWNAPPHHYCMFVTALVDESFEQESEETESVPVTRLWSDRIGDSFSIFLSLPRDYGKNKRKSYPVLYCLDANAYFDHLSSFIHDLSAKKSLSNEPILVGIGYENAYLMDSLRVRDLTFPKAPLSDSLLTSGGGDAFYEFIRSTVIPFVDGNYRTNTTQRTIMGHSFAGYFAAYALLSDLGQGSVFKNYVSASPSLWYNNGYLTKEINSHAVADSAPDRFTVFLSSGEEELKFGGEENFALFERSLLKFPSLRLKTIIYPHLDHMGAAIPAFEDAAEFLYGNGDVKN